MSKAWKLDNVSALIVDGVRYTLQRFQYRAVEYSSIYDWDLWTKDADQSGPGFKIEAPLVLADCKWGHWDNYSTAGRVDYDEATFYEGTFQHYGITGMPDPDIHQWTPPPYSLTVLMPHVDRKTGRNLVFSPLGVRAVLADDSTRTPNVGLYINGIQERIWGGGAHFKVQGGYYQRNWQGYALGHPHQD